jgi:phosphoribosylglycinamide formyltransferase-1
VILQAKVPVFPEDTADDLAKRVHQQEHRIYPLVVKWFGLGRLTMANEKSVLDGDILPIAGYANED